MKLDLKYGTGIRIFAILILIVFMLISSGCRSLKGNVKAATTVAEGTEVHAQDKKSTTTIDSSSTDMNHRSISTDSSQSTTTEVWFSKPDSSGIQHIERIKITETGSIKKINNESRLKTDDRSLHSEDQSNKSDFKSEINTQKQEKVATKQESVTKWPMIILAIGLIVLAYFVLKRFRILK
jgi:hypothetical protein